MQHDTIQYDTKIAIAVWTGLETWRKLNAVSFLAGGLVGQTPELIGEPYGDASGTQYGAMIRQPILVYEVEKADLTKANSRALSRGVVPIVFTADLFETGNDRDNRAAVAAVPLENLDLVAIALHEDRKTVDKVMKGMKLHP